MRRGPTGVAVLALGAVAAWTAPSKAQERCAVPPGGGAALGELAPSARLGFMRATLDDQAKRASLWNWGWAATGIGLAGGSYGLAALKTDSNQRLANIVGGTPALWYPLIAVVAPPEVIDDDRALADLMTVTASTEGRMDTCVLVARAEYLLARAANDEKAHSSLFLHILGNAVSIGIGIFIATALHDPLDGILNGVGGVFVGELNLWTAPTGAVGALARYKEGELALASRPRAVGLWLPLSW